MKLTAIGIDIAKNVFQVHGVDEHGKILLRKQVKREQFLTFLANLKPCLIGLEACGGAHHWARRLSALGHTVRLIAPQFVTPYVKGNKHDAADAAAICEALTRPSMRFVPVKTPEAQALLALHRARSGFVKARTAQANQIRGLLGEFGIVAPKGLAKLRVKIPEVLEDAGNDLPAPMRALLARLRDHLEALETQAHELEAQIQAWHRQNEASRRLAGIPGIGPLTASALTASVGDVRCFKNGRQLAAWLGLVPRQHSTGGKTVLLGISKRGDAYLRTLMIHGARAVLKAATNKDDPRSFWLTELAARRHKNIAAVALANKNARIAWALLRHGGEYASKAGTRMT